MTQPTLSEEDVIEPRCQQLLDQYPMLAHHADEPCRRMLNEVQMVDIPSGATMFHESDPCSNFMWLLEGSVRVFKNSEEGREVTLYRVSPGELCLLSLNSLLSGKGYPASAVSESSIRGLVISATQFNQSLDVSQGFRSYVMLSLAERMSDMISLVSDITFRRLELRLACMLGQRFERSSGQPLIITHAELAQELGSTREVISRILKEFERQECISLARGEIHLVSQDGLEWFTDADKAG